MYIRKLFRNVLKTETEFLIVESRNHPKKRGDSEKPYEYENLNHLSMLKKLKLFIAVIAAAAFLSGCSLTLPVNATSNPVGDKVGTAKATGYLGVLFFDADASIQQAAKNGGITKISTVDIKHTSVLNIIVTYETIVTGE